MNHVKFDLWLILGFIAFILSIVILSHSTNWINAGFAPYIDPIIGIGTFATAIIIAYRGWKDKIPKKLTVHFKYEGKYIFTCHKAYLSGEGDIRPWGQQIGRQMNDGKPLDFYPYIRQQAPKVEEVDRITGRIKDKSRFKYMKWLFFDAFYKHYVVTFFLYKPSYIKDCYIVSWDNSDNTENNSSITETKNKSIKIKNYNFNNAISEEEAETVLQAKYNEEKTIELKRIKKEQNIKLDLNMVEIIDYTLSEKPQGASRILINLSNHPSSGWSDAQKKTAEEAFGRIQDMPFPNIEPSLCSEDLDKIVQEYLNEIIRKKPLAVHIAGEAVFVFRMVSKLKEHNIKCISSTTRREVIEDGDTKMSVFKFVRFREY